MIILNGLNGDKYNLAEKSFNSGGEGDLFDITNKSGYVAKLYKNGKAPHGIGTKIQYMINHSPSYGVLNQVAWPLDMLKDSNGYLRGFIMKKLNISNELNELYKYPPTKNSFVTTEQKIIIAINIASVISEVHKANFGDFNPRNIGVDMKTGHVAFLDTDSYHIVLDKATNNAFRCKVGFDGYIAPELLDKIENEKKVNPANANYEKAQLDTFTEYTDNFALAIHVFKLLMNGYTPFNGVSEFSTVSMPYPGVGNDAIKRNSYCFKHGNRPLSAATPSLKSLPKYISKLFTLAFVDGRKNPELRPSANNWYEALNKYHRELKYCKSDPRHFYYQSLKNCPFCEADKKYRSTLVCKTPKTKKISQRSIVMPSKSFRNHRPINVGTETEKKLYVFYAVTLFLSTLAAWCIACFIAPLVFNPEKIMKLIANAAPYIVFLSGITGCLIYNIKYSNMLGFKDYAASVLAAVLLSSVVGIVLYILAFILPLLLGLFLLLACACAGSKSKKK